MATQTWTVSGDSYRGMVAQLRARVGSENGTVQVHDTKGEVRGFPKLKAGQALAIFRALQRASARSTVRLDEAEWELAWLALGWLKDGDRFIMTRAQYDSQYPSEELGAFWDFAADVGTHLDEEGTVVRPLFIEYGMPAYEAGAREAWTAMKRLRDTAILPLPVLPPSEGSSGFPWWLILAALLLGRRSRR